jgi:hypothetical protein
VVPAILGLVLPAAALQNDRILPEEVEGRQTVTPFERLMEPLHRGKRVQ